MKATQKIDIEKELLTSVEQIALKERRTKTAQVNAIIAEWMAMKQVPAPQPNAA